jgi:hypothetical protein
MKARAFAKSKRTRKEYEAARYFVTNPHKMTHYFLNRGIDLFLLAGLLLMTIFSTLYGPVFTGVQQTIRIFLGFGVMLFLGFIILQAIQQLHSIYYRVEFWDEYKKQTLLDLPDVED